MRNSGSGRPRVERSVLVVRIGVVVVGIFLAYLSIAVTVANAVASRTPTLALRLWPGHADGHVYTARYVLTANPAEPDFAKIVPQSVAALRRDPTSAEATRNIALYRAAQGDLAGADKLFAHAEALSRRDVPTQFWLIERRVAAGDVPGALAHYGNILQTSPGTQAQLFPILIGALGDPALVRPIAQLVQRGSSWRSTFLYQVNSDVKNLRSAVAFYRELAALRVPIEHVHAFGLVARLLQEGELDLAGVQYQLIDPAWRKDSVQSQLDGGFDRQGDLAPLGWQLDSAVAWRAPRGAQNPALNLNLPDTGVAMGATRTLMLPAGSYRIDARIGRVEGAGEGTLRIALACAKDGPPKSEIVAPIPKAEGVVSGTLNAAACGLQVLTIQVERTVPGDPSTIWLDDLHLSAAAAPRG